MSVNERFEQIISTQYGGHKRAFAKSAGVPATVIENIVGTRQGKPSFEVLEKICANANISAEWLLSGEGEMIRDGGASKSRSEEKKLIPFFDDVATIGGYNDSVASVSEPHGHVAEWIDAGDWFPEATAAIRQYGDSMVEYPSGSILALKRVKDTRLILNGRNYVIETTEFRVTKQLQDDGGEVIMAYSSNTETYPDGRQIHSPIRIPKDTIRHIDLVLGCVTKEFSNGAIPIIK